MRNIPEERGRNMDAILWLAAVVVLLVIEIATLGLTTIWFAGGALIAGIAAVAGAGRVVQFVLFLIVSLILLIFTRPIAMRYLNTNRTRTNAESLIGKEAVVTQTIENLKNQGQVIVGGIEWTARTDDNEKMIEKDTVVEIERIEGVKIDCEKERITGKKNGWTYISDFDFSVSGCHCNILYQSSSTGKSLCH